jgi:hypothetical protein
MLAPFPACSLNHNSRCKGIPYSDSFSPDTALIEIADAAEREWLLCCDGMSGRGKVQMRPMY